MINTAVKKNNSVLKDTINMLFGLDDNKLIEVQSFIRENSEEKEEDLFKDLYKPLTEAELVERIDRSLAHIHDGTAMDAEEFIQELESEFGL